MLDISKEPSDQELISEEMGADETTDLRMGRSGGFRGGGFRGGYHRPAFRRTSIYHSYGYHGPSFGNHIYVGGYGGYGYGYHSYYSYRYNRVVYVRSQPLGIVGTLFVIIFVAIIICVIIVAGSMTN